MHALRGYTKGHDTGAAAAAVRADKGTKQGSLDAHNGFGGRTKHATLPSSATKEMIAAQAKDQKLKWSRLPLTDSHRRFTSFGRSLCGKSPKILLFSPEVVVLSPPPPPPPAGAYS